MTPETINGIKEALAPVAEKIGQGAEYGWEILVWGQFAEGVADIVISTIVGIIAAIIATKAYKYAKKKQQEDDYYDSDALFAFWLLGGGIVIITAFIVGAGIYNGVVSVVAPEYAALKFLIGTVK